MMNDDELRSRMARLADTTAIDTVTLEQVEARSRRRTLRQRSATVLAAFALSVIEPDALAALEAGHAVADRLDDTGAVALRYDKRIELILVSAEPASYAFVRRIDAGGKDADQDFSRARYRRRFLAENQDLAGGAPLFVPDGTHAAIPLRCRAGCRTAPAPLASDLPGG